VDEKGPGASGVATAVKGKRAKGRAKGRKGPTCEECFFGCRGLCALDLGGPCATFRPDSPDGLLPPRQPALLLRESERDVVVAAG
jgi:hypothetical protein